MGTTSSPWVKLCILLIIVKMASGDFLGGPVDKKPPANAEDMGSIPGQGRFHMPEQSLCATTTEPPP